MRAMVVLLAGLCTGACGADAVTDKELLCSIVGVSAWTSTSATSADFSPDGISVRRLTPAIRRHLNDPGTWRDLPLEPAFAADPDRFCDHPTIEVEEVSVSEDFQWARVEFAERFGSMYRTKVCLAIRQGEQWLERECEINVIADPSEG